MRAADASDVARVVSLARETGAELAVRSGGHSRAGHGTTEGGIVLDLSRMNGVEIDAAGRSAWAQTGITAGEYTAATAEHGLATGLGDTASVGLGGITLGGGIGFLVRKHGLAIDDLLAAEVVTADGEILAGRRRRRTPTSSGRCGAAAATSASRPAFGSGSTRSTQSSAGCSCSPRTPT